MTRNLYQRLIELFDRFPPDEWLWVVSWSGGKDSTVLLLSVMELAFKRGFNFMILHHDTRSELPCVKRVVSEAVSWLKKRGLSVLITKPRLHFFEYMLLLNYSFPRWNFRWCSRVLKWEPLASTLNSLKHAKVLNLIGERGDENGRRKAEFIRTKVWRTAAGVKNKKVIVATPLVDLTLNDVWSYLEAYKDIHWIRRLLTLYQVRDAGYRLGCWHCTVARPFSIAFLNPRLFSITVDLVETYCKDFAQFLEKLIKVAKERPELFDDRSENVIILAERMLARAHLYKYPCGRKCDKCAIKWWLARATWLLKDFIL